MVGLIADSQRVYTTGDPPVPRPRGEPLATHASTGGPPTVAGSFGSVSCGVTVPLLQVLVCAKFCLCSPRRESLFPTVSWEAYDQILLTLKARFPGDFQSFVASQAGNPDMGFRTFTTVGDHLWYMLSSLWIIHLASMGFDFMVIAPLLPSHCSIFVFGRGVSFVGGLQCPVDGCTAS